MHESHALCRILTLNSLLLFPSLVSKSRYSSTYEALARRGLRVLALAHRRVSASEEAAFAAGTGAKDQPRTWVEANLTFSGFIAFECKIRADSKIVVKALRAADHKVAGGFGLFLALLFYFLRMFIVDL